MLHRMCLACRLSGSAPILLASSHYGRFRGPPNSVRAAISYHDRTDLTGGGIAVGRCFNIAPGLHATSAYRCFRSKRGNKPIPEANRTRGKPGVPAPPSGQPAAANAQTATLRRRRRPRPSGTANQAAAESRLRKRR